MLLNSFYLHATLFIKAQASYWLNDQVSLHNFKRPTSNPSKCQFISFLYKYLLIFYSTFPDPIKKMLKFLLLFVRFDQDNLGPAGILLYNFGVIPS